MLATLQAELILASQSIHRTFLAWVDRLCFKRSHPKSKFTIRQRMKGDHTQRFWNISLRPKSDTQKCARTVGRLNVSCFSFLPFDCLVKSVREEWIVLFGWLHKYYDLWTPRMFEHKQHSWKMVWDERRKKTPRRGNDDASSLFVSLLFSNTNIFHLLWQWYPELWVEVHWSGHFRIAPLNVVRRESRSETEKLK